MRRKIAVLLATALAGGTIAVGAATPAHACHEVADDPIYNWVCTATHNAPPIKDTVGHYAGVVFDTVHLVYCTASPNC